MSDIFVGLDPSLMKISGSILNLLPITSANCLGLDQAWWFQTVWHFNGFLPASQYFCCLLHMSAHVLK